jgi:hypothetical protein
MGLRISSAAERPVASKKMKNVYVLSTPSQRPQPRGNPRRNSGLQWTNVHKLLPEAKRQELYRFLCGMGSHQCLEWVLDNWERFDAVDERGYLLLEAWGETNLNMPSADFSICELVEKFREVGVVSNFDLPDHRLPLTLYRGCLDPNLPSMAWTTEQSVAEKFASGLHRPHVRTGNAFIMKARCVKSAILGFTNSRGEAEVIICPSGLRNLKIIAEVQRSPSG